MKYTGGILVFSVIFEKTIVLGIISILVKSIKTAKKKSTDMLFQVQSKMKFLGSELEFFETNTDCPTCQQPIKDDFREGEIDKRKDKVRKAEMLVRKLERQLEKYTNRVQECLKVNVEVSNCQSEVRVVQQRISMQERFIARSRGEIKEISKHTGNISEARSKLKILEAEAADHEEKRFELESQSRIYRIAITLLKDSGIKTIIIKQYLPIINKLVNKYLASMDFFVNFTLSEQFDETIKSRFRDEFSYESFSEGEKQRIDLALLFTWRQVAQMKNSLHTNLLVFDEIFDSSLDNTGTEAFLALLDHLPKTTNVIVISHKGDTICDKFDSTLRFEKRKNFSELSIGDYNGKGDVV